MKRTSIKLKAILQAMALSTVLALAFVLPAEAAGPPLPQSFLDLVCITVFLALDFIPLIVIFAMGAMIQGLIKYVGNGDNEEKRSAGRKMMIYGVVGFFFMVSIWGILEIFANSYGIRVFVPQFTSDSSKPEGCKAPTPKQNAYRDSVLNGENMSEEEKKKALLEAIDEMYADPNVRDNNFHLFGIPIPGVENPYNN